MNSLPSDRFYTPGDYWLRVDERTWTLGLTPRGEQELGELTFAELPALGARFERGQSLGIIESVKSVSEIFAPVGGEVVAVNERVVETPEIVNESPLGDGWLLKLRVDEDAAMPALLSAEDYARLRL
jgi:glycine cleavage system H protein